MCTADGAKSWWHPPVGRARLVAGTADGQKLWAATQVTTKTDEWIAKIQGTAPPGK